MIYLRSGYLWREHPDGRREIGKGLWVLIWIAPVLFLLSGAAMLGFETWRHVASVPGKGTVVRVYSWEGETIFDRGTTNYSPVFEYVWSDGKPTQATPGLAHPDWNFEIGSVHDIRWFRNARRNVVLPGLQNWLAGLIILGIGAVCLIPALWITARLRRWVRAGQGAGQGAGA